MLLGDWSKSFLNFHKGVLGNAEPMAALRLIAPVAYTDIWQIEQRHAALKRRLNVMGPRDVASHIAVKSYRYRNLKCRQLHAKSARTEKPEALTVGKSFP